MNRPVQGCGVKAQPLDCPDVAGESSFGQVVLYEKPKDREGGGQKEKSCPQDRKGQKPFSPGSDKGMGHGISSQSQPQVQE